MKARLNTGAFLFVAFYHLCFCKEKCKLPKPGKCSSDSTTASPAVCELNAGTCDFNSSSGLCLYEQGCADPHMSKWTVVEDHVQAGQDGPVTCTSREYYYSVLESPWLHVTHPSCLKFSYSRAHPAALDVFLDQQDGGIRTVLNRSNDNAADNVRTHVKRDVDHGIRKVIFRAYGGGAGKYQFVKVFNVSVEPGSCTPSAASTSPVPSATAATASSSPHCQDTSTSATTTGQMPSTIDRDEQGGSNAGAIGGGVAVAVIFIAVAVIVVIVVLRRRRQQKKNKDKRITTTLGRKTDENPAVLSKSRNDYTSNHASRFAPSAPQEDGDYSTIADGETPSIHGTEVNPYDLAQDPIDEGPQSPEEDDYHRIIADGFPDTALPPGPVNDDYHHINSPRNLPDPGTKYSYTNVQKKGKTFGQTGEGTVGNEGTKTVQVTPDATNGYSLAKMVPSIQRKRDGDAATSAIAHGSSSSGGGATVPAPYNKVNTSSANAADTPNSPTKVDQEASTGNYFILEAAPDGGQLEQTASRDGNGVEDDYNMLNRDHSSSQRALAKDSGKPIKSYDHVRNKPGDDYSTCDDGKRTIVIDSGYDHVELKNGKKE